MKLLLLISPLLLFSISCTTLNDSIKLGATMGAMSGVAATHAGYSRAGESPSSEEVASGLAVGLAVGLITSYITHKEVELDRKAATKKTQEIFFGDLPPNPFIYPNHNQGGR